VTVTNSNFEGTKVGHDIKSRAAQSTITGNTFDDSATASYSIDLPNGGNAVVANNVFAKAATAQNAPAIHYGGEVANPIGSLLIQNNVFVNQRANGVVVLNQAVGLTVNVTGNFIYGESAVASGSTATVKQSGNTVAAKPPAKLPLPTGYNEKSSAIFQDLLTLFKLSA
jgi:Right handed beta helix region